MEAMATARNLHVIYWCTGKRSHNCVLYIDGNGQSYPGGTHCVF